MHINRHAVLVASLALLAGCSEASSTTDDSAATRPTPRASTSPVYRPVVESFDEGGIPGCYDPAQVTAQRREIAERMGGKPCEPSAAATAQAVATPAATSWEGKYRGGFDGGEGNVTITKNKAGFPYDINVTVAGGGCSGEFSMGALFVGRALRANLPTGDQASGTLGTQACTVTVTRQGNKIHVEESGLGCTEVHGASCGFTGTATKVR